MIDFDHIVTELESFHISPIFDTSKEAIKLRGTRSNVDMEKGEKLLKYLIDQVKLEEPPKRKVEVPTRKMLRKKLNQQVSPAGPVKISALDPGEDEEALTTWTNFVLPQLPKAVEGLPIGDKYSAALVRQEGSDGMPVPIIRFRSSNGQSEAARKNIRTQIQNICKQNSRPVIPVQFSQGIMVPLVGWNPKRSEDCLVADDNPPNDQKRFAHQRRFWHKVGMGASIGMKVCPHISATSGGYILIDGRKYMLSVDHFIQAATECEICRVSTWNTTINSPSPGDVDELIQDLGNKLNELELKVRDTTPQEEIPLNQVRQVLLPKEIGDELDLYRRFRQELLKDTKEFELGDVHYRCIQDSIRESTLPRPTDANPPMHRMDWSISEVRKQREGKNVHRHRQTTELAIEDFKGELLKPEGAGKPCEETAEPRGGDSVHYVGQNGLHYGKVSPALSLIGDKCGGVSEEWAIVVSGSDKESTNCFEGDSGAWIIRDDNKLIGLLWGWDNYQLLFTPIQDVFADIVRVVNGAKNVCLPPHSRSKLLGAMRINRRHNLRPKTLASTYVGPRLEEQLLSTEEAKAKPDLSVTADLDTSTQSEVHTVTANDEVSGPPLSPVPSLASSAGSRYSSKSSSPQPSSPSPPLQPLGDLVHLAGELTIESGAQSLHQVPGELEELQQLELEEYPKFGKTLKKSFSMEHLKILEERSLVKHFSTWPCNEEIRYG